MPLYRMKGRTSNYGFPCVYRWLEENKGADDRIDGILHMGEILYVFGRFNIKRLGEMGVYFEEIDFNVDELRIHLPPTGKPAISLFKNSPQ